MDANLGMDLGNFFSIISVRSWLDEHLVSDFIDIGALVGQNPDACGISVRGFEYVRCG
ncbi:hypothetical protein [Anaplasma marginale]|uniref:hypothetical protein n=2 Tax=Anaplasma marginale TaxID=770 RepID=UPI0012FD1EDB|nr:hypothetical protein [Anaplasma marginale]